MRWKLPLAVVSLAVLCGTPQALAQPRSYDDVIAEAVDEFKRGHYEEARTLFGQAHEQRPSARTFRGLGIVEFELRHYAQSADLLRAALEDERKPLTPELRSNVEQLRTRALAFVGRYMLELHPRTASVAVDGAARTLDSDGVLLLDAGEHRVVVTATGHGTQVRTVDVVGGEDTRMTVKLAPLVDPKEAASGPASRRPDAASVDVEDGRRSRRIWLAVSAVVIAVAGGVTAGVLAFGGDDTANDYTGTTGAVFQGPQGAR